MKKLTKAELINALCAVQLENAKKRGAELKDILTDNRRNIIIQLSDYIKDLCKGEMFLYEFISDNLDTLICCEYKRYAILDLINKRRTLSSEHAYVQSQIACPLLIKKRANCLLDPTKTITIEDGHTIYDNETLEAERKRIFGD